jgi:drug/metabolite transporter (DMT)-like permease
MRIKADLVLFLVAILWGSAFVAQRAAGILGSVFLFNAARFVLAGLMLLPLAWRLPITAAQMVWMVLAGLILFVASALQQAGLLVTTAGNAGFLTSLYVVLVPLVLLFGWRERPGALSMIAVGLAVVGAYLLTTGGRLEIRSGDLLELSGAAFWALHVVLLGKVAARYDAIAFSAGQLLVAGLLNVIATFLFERPFAAISAVFVTSVLYTAIFSLGLGYTLQIWGQRHTQPTDAAIILSLEAVVAAIAGALLLGERLQPVQVAGCAIIVLAVLVSQLSAWSRMQRLLREETSHKGKEAPDLGPAAR